jgi:hypothetical protein
MSNINTININLDYIIHLDHDCEEGEEEDCPCGNDNAIVCEEEDCEDCHRGKFCDCETKGCPHCNKKEDEDEEEEEPCEMCGGTHCLNDDDPCDETCPENCCNKPESIAEHERAGDEFVAYLEAKRKAEGK